MARQPLLQRYPIDEWIVHWSASYGGPGVYNCSLTHPKVRGQLNGDIRKYFHRPKVVEDIRTTGRTPFVDVPGQVDKLEPLMKADAMAPIRVALGLKAEG